MPIYEYRCTECEQIFEEWQKSYDDKEAVCPVCHAEAKRLISSTSFVLKGSGWYVTDYAGKKGADASSGNGNGNGNGNGKKDASGEKKEAAKSETSSAKSAESSASDAGGA